MKNKKLIYLSIFAILFSLCCYIYLNTNLIEYSQDLNISNYESGSVDEQSESMGFVDMAILESIANTIKYLATLSQ